MRSILKQQKRAIPDLLQGDVTATTSTEKANLLNTFFVSQSQQSVGDPNIPPPPISLPLVTDEDSITTLETDVEEVRSLLASVDTSKSPGADGVPT